MLPAQAIATKPPSFLKNVRFQVKFEETQYVVEANTKTFNFTGKRTHESFEVRACNRPAVDDFIRQYEHLRKTDLRLPASLVGKRALALKDGTKEIQIFSSGKFGLWLREVPSRTRTLLLTAEAECKHAN